MERQKLQDLQQIWKLHNTAICLSMKCTLHDKDEAEAGRHGLIHDRMQRNCPTHSCAQCSHSLDNH